MSEVRVVEWCSPDDVEDRLVSIGDFGGFFKKGMRWSDYVDAEGQSGYIDAIRQDALKRNIKVTGAMHQVDYIPLFSDGTIGSFSMRAWGDLMAAIWSEAEDKDYSYLDFYC